MQNLNLTELDSALTEGRGLTMNEAPQLRGIGAEFTAFVVAESDVDILLERSSKLLLLLVRYGALGADSTKLLPSVRLYLRCLLSNPY